MERLTPSSATPQLCDLGQVASSLWSCLGYFTLDLLLPVPLIPTVITCVVSVLLARRQAP